jgi:hypothetical protein
MRDLSLRSPDGTRILGLFTPPFGSSEQVRDTLIRLALSRAEELGDCILWVNCSPLTIYRNEPHA